MLNDFVSQDIMNNEILSKLYYQFRVWLDSIDEINLILIEQRKQLEQHCVQEGGNQT